MSNISDLLFIRISYCKSSYPWVILYTIMLYVKLKKNSLNMQIDSNSSCCFFYYKWMHECETLHRIIYISKHFYSDNVRMLSSLLFQNFLLNPVDVIWNSCVDGRYIVSRTALCIWYKPNEIEWEFSIFFHRQHQWSTWVTWTRAICKYKRNEKKTIHIFVSIINPILYHLFPAWNPAHMTRWLKWISVASSPIFLYIFRQSLLATTGTCSCIKTGDFWPCSFVKPQPATKWSYQMVD